MAGTGFGQEFTFGATTLPQVEDIQVTSKGQILSKVVADTASPIATSIPGLVTYRVTFNLPATTPHTTLSAIAQGTTGAIEADKVDGVKFSSSAGEAVGYDVSSPSGGWVTVTAEFVGNGTFAVAAQDA